VTRTMTGSKRYSPFGYNFTTPVYTDLEMRLTAAKSESVTYYLYFRNVGDGNTLKVTYGSSTGMYNWVRVFDEAQLAKDMMYNATMYAPSQWTPMTLAQFQAETAAYFAPKGSGNDSYFNYPAQIPHLKFMNYWVGYYGTLESESNVSPSYYPPPPWSGTYSDLGLVFVNGLQGSRSLQYGGSDNIHDDPRTLPIHADLTATFRDVDTLDFSFYRRN